MRQALLFLAGSLALFTVAAHAETALTEQQALKLAYAQHPQMVQVRQQIRAARGQWQQALSLPETEFELEIGGYKADSGGSRNGEVEVIGVRQPLDMLSTGFLNVAAARNDYNALRENEAVVWAHVRSEVIGLYASILAAEKALDTAQRNLDATRQFFTRVETAFQSGSSKRVDVLRARLEVTQAENELLAARKTHKLLGARLNLAMGLDPETALQPAESLDYQPLRSTYEAALAQALAERADLRRQVFTVKASKQRTWAERLGVLLPKFSLGIERTTADYENDTSILIGASYPLGGFNWGAVREAQARQDLAESQLEILKRTVHYEVYEAFLEAELADQQVVLQRKALEAADELLRSITVEYQEGEASFLAFLEHLRTIKRTRNDYIEQLKDYRMRVAALEKAVQQTPIPEDD